MNWLHKISFPTLTDEYGQPRSFYHGTSNNFEQFEHKPGKRGILFTEYDVNVPGHFFSENEEDAQEYGSKVIKRKLNVDRMLLDPNIQHLGIDRLPRELESDLRYILYPLIQDGWLEVGPRTVKVRDRDWIYDLISYDGLLWYALDNPQVVERMKQRGYDGTYVSEDNGERSIFVLDNKQIISSANIQWLHKISQSAVRIDFGQYAEHVLQYFMEMSDRAAARGDNSFSYDDARESAEYIKQQTE